MKAEELTDRIKQLEEAKLTAIAQVNAILGAIQECSYWLELLNKADKKEEPCQKTG